MIDWRIVLALVICAIIAFAVLESKVVDTIRMRRLKLVNRCIDAEQAIEEFEAGRGALIRNRSSLPGEWWYLAKDKRPTNHDPMMTLRECGRVLVFKNKLVRKRMKDFEGLVMEFYEPLED